MKKIGFDASIGGLTKGYCVPGTLDDDPCVDGRGMPTATGTLLLLMSHVSDAWHTVSVVIAKVYGSPARLADFLLPRYC